MTKQKLVEVMYAQVQQNGYIKEFSHYLLSFTQFPISLWNIHFNLIHNICEVAVLTSETHEDLHRESKKQDTKLLAITSLIISRILKFFH